MNMAISELDSVLQQIGGEFYYEDCEVHGKAKEHIMVFDDADSACGGTACLHCIKKLIDVLGI